MAHGTFLSPTYTLHIYKEKKLTPLLHPLPMIPLLRLSPGRLTSIRAALHEHGYSNTSAVTLTTQADIVIPPHPEVESCGFCKPTDQDGQGVLPKYLYSCAGSKCTPVADKNQNGTGQATFSQFFSSFCSPMQGIGQAIKRKIRSPWYIHSSPPAQACASLYAEQQRAVMKAELEEPTRSSRPRECAGRRRRASRSVGRALAR